MSATAEPSGHYVNIEPGMEYAGGSTTYYWPSGEPDLSGRVAELEAENAKLRRHVAALLEALSVMTED